MNILHAVPVELQPEAFMPHRAQLIPGVRLQRYTGAMAQQIDDFFERSRNRSGVLPTHLIVVDQSLYFEKLDERLRAEGKDRAINYLDMPGITRQVLICATLLGRLTWTVAGSHTFKPLPGRRVRHASYSSGLKWSVWPLLRGSSEGWYSEVRPARLRAITTQLDLYYRTGNYWVDRLGVALGYLWSAMTSPHPELVFAALCMALEAIATTQRSEITHILAERCAILAAHGPQSRTQVYAQVKRLYDVRSKIVHGGSAPRRGPVTWESLAITAKSSMVPRTKLLEMFALTLDVINGVLRAPALLKILHTEGNEETAGRAIDAHFQSILLR